jgi:hypothetical protein
MCDIRSTVHHLAASLAMLQEASTQTSSKAMFQALRPSPSASNKRLLKVEPMKSKTAAQLNLHSALRLTK